MDDASAAVPDDASDDVQVGWPGCDGLTVRVGVRQPREDVPPVGDDGDEPRHRPAALESSCREAGSAPLALELVEVVFAVAAVPVELRERGRVHRRVVRHEDVSVPFAPVPVLRELEHLLTRSPLRLRASGEGKALPVGGHGRMPPGHRPTDEDESSREPPCAQPHVMLVGFPSAAAVLPSAVVRQEREQLLRQACASDLEEASETARLGLGHDAVAPVADIPAQEEGPRASGERVKERPEAGHAARARAPSAGKDVDAQCDARTTDEERMVAMARASRLPRVVAELRAFLTAEDRLDGAVDVDDVPEAEHRVHGLVLVPGESGVERHAVRLAHCPPDRILRDDPPEAEQFHRGGVVPERVDLHVPVLAGQDR